MTGENCIKYKSYDSRLYNELTRRSFAGEKLTEAEEDYMRYCYHYEEWQAGLL